MMTEHHEQVALFAWLEMRYPDLPIFAIPNGGWRNKITAAKLKAEGVKAGVPDIFLALARQGCHGLFIEMKRREDGRLSPNQKLWLARIQAGGYAGLVCRGWDEARQVIENYLR